MAKNKTGRGSGIQDGSRRGRFTDEVTYKTTVDQQIPSVVRRIAKKIGLGPPPEPKQKPPKVLSDPDAPLTNRAGRLKK